LKGKKAFRSLSTPASTLKHVEHNVETVMFPQKLYFSECLVIVEVLYKSHNDNSKLWMMLSQ